MFLIVFVPRGTARNHCFAKASVEQVLLCHGSAMCFPVAPGSRHRLNLVGGLGICESIIDIAPLRLPEPVPLPLPTMLWTDRFASSDVPTCHD